MKKFLLVGGLWLGLSAHAQKITLVPDNLINVSAKGDIHTLIDEQDKAGDPASNPHCTTCPSTSFTNGYINQVLYYPLEVIIDLRSEYNVSSLYYYDIAGSDSISIATGTPDNWKTIIWGTTSKYNAWSANALNSKTRYLRLNIKSPSTAITEIVLYGSPTSTSLSLKASAASVTMVKPFMNDLIGMNTFFNVPDSIGKVVKCLREYHNWQWDEGNTSTTYAGFPNNQYAWNPSWVADSWNFDDFYTYTSQKGQVVSPVLQGAAPYVTGFGANASVNKPLISTSLDSEDPNSYKQHADYMYQFAARYGSTEVSASKLKVRSTNKPLSGLGVLQYMENWNEPDKDWDGRSAYFKPFELAAMSSADYDGHMSTMGATFGLKNADPNMKFVLSGLINMDSLYIKSMLFWSNYFRNGSIPFDVINFHHYSNDVGGQGGVPTTGVSPEDDNLKTKVHQMTLFRNKYLPGKEVWYSEFGYDTHPKSVQRAPAIGNQDAWETQARWIVRSLLAYAAGGADKAHIYMARDVDESSTLYNTSGLTTPSYDGTYKAYTKKKSWYYVYTLRKRLTKYRFRQEIYSGNPNVSIYAFQSAMDPKDWVFAVWSPTSTDLTVSNYNLMLPANTLQASKVELMNKDTSGVETALAIKGGAVSFNVDEKPDLILFRTSEAVPNIGLALVTSAREDVETETSEPASFFQVYPNPFTSTVKINVPATEQLVQVVVKDMRGTTLRTFTGNDAADFLNLEGLAKGVYLVEGTTDKNIHVTKIIKN